MVEFKCHTHSKWVLLDLTQAVCLKYFLFGCRTNRDSDDETLKKINHFNWGKTMPAINDTHRLDGARISAITPNNKSQPLLKNI